MTELDGALRLLIALGLGSFIGIERQLRGQFAGLKTHALVSLGAALFVVISELVIASSATVVADPLRMASQIVVGIGFIGGGAIVLKSESIVRGLSTAAGLWVAAGVGVAVGYGLYVLAVAASIIVFFMFAVIGPLEEKLK